VFQKSTIDRYLKRLNDIEVSKAFSELNDDEIKIIEES